MYLHGYFSIEFKLHIMGRVYRGTVSFFAQAAKSARQTGPVHIRTEFNSRCEKQGQDRR